MVIFTLSLLLAPNSDAAPQDYNNYSNIYDVWAYYYHDEPKEEIYTVQETNPNIVENHYIELSYFDLPNTDLPVIIISTDFTAYLESLSEEEYKTAVKPILLHALLESKKACIHSDLCDYKLRTQIRADKFIASIKESMTKIVAIVNQSMYLELFLKSQMHIWYELYWSLKTENDTKPVLSYHENFNDLYHTCFYGESPDIVIIVRDTMAMLLKIGFRQKEYDFLQTIGKRWLECIHREYDHSMQILKRGTSWEHQFLRNLTMYVKAGTMLTYMLNHIDDTYYNYATPQKLIHLLEEEYKNSVYLAEPMIYSLYIPLFIEPYILYIKQIKADQFLFEQDLNLAYLPLDTTAYNEIIPFKASLDKFTLESFITEHAHHKQVNMQNITEKLGKFVKFATKNIVRGHIILHAPIFRIAYQAYNLGSSFYNLLYEKENYDYINVLPFGNLRKLLHTPKIMSLETRMNKIKNMPTHNSEPRWAYRTHNPHNIKYNVMVGALQHSDIDIIKLRYRAPKSLDTIKLTQNIRKAFIASKPIDIELQFLEIGCKEYTGTSSLTSHSQLAFYLKRLIDLYFEFRHFRPYDFFAEQKNTIQFIKSAYNLYNLRHFTYFQTYMVLYLQSMITLLADPDFLYTSTKKEFASAQIHLATRNCDLKLAEDDLTSILVSFRSMQGGKKLLSRYAGESGIIYNTFLRAAEKQRFNNLEFRHVYAKYRSKNHLDLFDGAVQKLYFAFKNPYFRLYAIIQDPIMFAKIIADLVVIMDNAQSL